MAFGKIFLATVSGISLVALGYGFSVGLGGGVKKAQAIVNPNGNITKTQSPQEMFTPPTYVQLKPFMAPTRDGDGLNSTPVTVFIESHRSDWIGTICQHHPRLRDVVLTILYQAPISVTGGPDELENLEYNLVEPINMALGRNFVKSVRVVLGAKKMSSGAVARLPFNSAGCKGIKDIREALR